MGKGKLQSDVIPPISLLGTPRVCINQPGKGEGLYKDEGKKNGKKIADDIASEISNPTFGAENQRE
jgi:hypothetical protein